MTLAILDLSALMPDFASSVNGLHAVLANVAFVVCVAALIVLAWLGFQERGLHSVKRGLVSIVIVVLLLGGLAAVGNAIVDVVNDLGSMLPGGNGNVFQMYTQAIKQKFGVDLSGLNQLVPNAPFGSTGQPGDALLTHYAYPGDSTPDPNSGNGIGNHNNQLTAYQGPGQVASAALTSSAVAYYGVSLGQTFSVTTAHNGTLNLRYDDTAPESDMRVDVYDPNGLLAGGNDFSDSVRSESNGPVTAAENSPVGSFINAMIHPVEATGAVFFGLAVLFLSYIALGLMWLIAALQAILFNALWAVSPLFLGFLAVRGWENIGKGFLASFIAVCLWPLAFVIGAMITRLLLGFAINSSNNPVLGVSNIAGMQYFWLIVTAVWVIFFSIAGPWFISNRVVRGASGVPEVLLAAGAAAMAAAQRLIGMAQIAGKGVIAGIGGSGSPPVASSRPSVAVVPNYARRPINDGAPKQS